MTARPWSLEPWDIEQGTGRHGGTLIEIVATENHPAHNRVHVASFETIEDATLCRSAPALYEALAALLLSGAVIATDASAEAVLRAHDALRAARGEEAVDAP